MSKQQNHKTPFKLEPDGPLKKESAYIAEQKERNRRKHRLGLLALTAGLVICFLWASIVQFRLMAQKQTIEEANKILSKVAFLEKNIKKQESTIDSLLLLNANLQNQIELQAETSTIPRGIFFEVQLGDFKDFNLNNYLNNLAAIHQYKYQSGTKLLLGRFRSFNKALLFEEDLKQMGIKNATLVGRIDGTIVPYQEALDALRAGNN